MYVAHGKPSLALNVGTNETDSAAVIRDDGTSSSRQSADPTAEAVYANYSSGNGTSELLFVYVVEGGQVTDHLDYSSPAVLALSAPFGSIVAKETLDAVYLGSLPDPGEEGSLGWNKAIVIYNQGLLVERVSCEAWR